jgi:rhamnose transport system permease protein
MMRHSSTHPAPVQPPLPKRSAGTPGGFVASLAKSRETTLFVVLILLIAGTGLAKPQFLN